MDSATARRLVDLNRQFYQTFADDFSVTRQRLQPGVRRVLSVLDGSENILDLGCGNGETARSLAQAGFSGTFLGLDFAPALLVLARRGLDPAQFRFAEADLTGGRWPAAIESGRLFDVAFSFATMHHIPSSRARLEMVKTIHTLLKPGGRFVHSHWQFLNSEKLKGRIQPWAYAGLPVSAVDEGDYLLAWRGSGEEHGLRYAHHFSEAELGQLAEAGGFEVLETFHSDGQGGRLGLYQVWRPGGGLTLDAPRISA
jgi:SAM-dependent methyltransferase